MKFEAFAEEYGIEVDALLVDRDPDRHMETWTEGVNHWNVTLSRMIGSNHIEIMVPFSTGPAVGEPTTQDVLEALQSDVHMVDNAPDFETWCGELGYDTDSRKALATYEKQLRLAQQVRFFMHDQLPVFLAVRL